MASLTPQFKAPIFSYNQPLVIASNRNTAFIYGIRLRYQADGYAAGTILARNTTDDMYQAYDSGGSSGTDVAAAILTDAYAEGDFTSDASSGFTLANGIFGGCSVYKAQLTGYDADVLTDLSARIIVVEGGVELLKF